MLTTILKTIWKFFFPPFPHNFKRCKLKRSYQWTSVRKKHLEIEPTCQVCGTKDNLNVHHIEPFHLHPEKELNQDNLITLCEHGCHFIIGHLCNWSSYNPNVRHDAAHWQAKIAKRQQ